MFWFKYILRYLHTCKNFYSIKDYVVLTSHKFCNWYQTFSELNLILCWGTTKFLAMSLWNTLRLLVNSVLVFGLGYSIRHLTHTKKYIPNGKEILTMAANKGNAALQYTMKKKNRTNVVIIVLFTILVVIVCYKLQRRFGNKSGSDSDDDDSISSLTRKTQGEEEFVNKKKKKWSNSMRNKMWFEYMFLIVILKSWVIIL